MKCPQCRNHVLQKSGSRTRLRIQGPVVFDENGLCHALCYWCKSEVLLPLSIQKGTPIDEERFVLTRKA